MWFILLDNVIQRYSLEGRLIKRPYDDPYCFHCIQ
jgi:hypothetical protein